MCDVCENKSKHHVDWEWAWCTLLVDDNILDLIWGGSYSNVGKIFIKFIKLNTKFVYFVDFIPHWKWNNVWELAKQQRFV